MRNDPCSSRRDAQGFTLIEMLLVITIILILAGLLLPAVQKAIVQAEKQKAQTAAFQIATALRNYQTEFGTWPDSSSNTVAVNIGPLIGGNSRRLVFLEVPAKSMSVSGSTTNYVDPWGGRYCAKFDQTCTGSLVPPGGSASIPNSVVVWSYGPKGTNSTATEWLKTW